MAKKKDWLKRPLPEWNTMFANVNQKIGGYQAAYELSDDWIESVQFLCTTFTTVYAKVAQNRATEKQMNDWFEALLRGEDTGDPVSSAPVFQAITVPAGATVGLLDQFREQMRYFKSNAAYTVADGENLMIVPTDGDGISIENPDDAALEEVAPDLKVSFSGASGAVRVSYTKGEFSGLEAQWRKAGTEAWQLADKSTEKIIEFTPEGVTPPENIEVRGIYLLKNQRVGEWSAIYTITIS